MPNIRQYENRVDGLQPTDRGVSALTQQGRRIGAFYHQTGAAIGGGIADLGEQYVKHVTTDQMIQGLKLKASATEELMKDWNETLANDQAAAVHNPHLFDDWKKAKLDPAMAGISETFSTEEGQKWWEEQSVALGQHFMEHGLADQSTMAGANAVRDFQETSNSAQSLAYNDPASANLARGMMEDAKTVAIRALGANASPEYINALDEHHRVTTSAITIAQARGLIDKSDTPEAAAQDFLSKPESVTHLDDNQREAVLGYGRTRQNVMEEKARAAEVAARKQLEDEGHGVYTRIVAGITNPKTGEINPGPKTWEAVAKFGQMYGNVLPAEAKGLIDTMREAQRRRVNHEDTVDDPHTYSQLMSSVGKPEGGGGLTHEMVDRAYASGRLSDHSYSKLNGLVEENKENPAVNQGWSVVNRIMDSLRPTITKSDPLTATFDTTGDASWAAYQGTVHRIFDARVAKGEDPVTVLHSMADPTSQLYIGHFTTPFISGAKWDSTVASYYAPAAGQNAAGGPSAVINGAPLPGEVGGASAARKSAVAGTPQQEHGIGVDGTPSVRVDISGQMQSLRNAQSHPLPARKPGETPEQYLARTGGD
jgi:hypothetical protein